jgi:hypothetical protein
LVAGTRPHGSSRKPARKYTSATERRCTVCGERLSTYNPGPNCFAHSATAVSRTGTPLRRAAH